MVARCVGRCAASSPPHAGRGQCFLPSLDSLNEVRPLVSLTSGSSFPNPAGSVVRWSCRLTRAGRGAPVFPLARRKKMSWLKEFEDGEHQFQLNVDGFTLGETVSA